MMLHIGTHALTTNFCCFIGRTSEAAEIYRNVSRLDEGHVDAICNLAVILSNEIYETTTDDKEVEDLYRNALR